MRKENSSDQLNHIYRIDSFNSFVPIKPPDADAYLAQKGVHFINLKVKNFPLPNKDIPINYIDPEDWQTIHTPLIELSINGNASKDNIYPKVFPGPVVSGPLLGQQYIGSTQWEIFNNMLSIPQRVIDPSRLKYDSSTGYVYLGENPPIELSDIPKPQRWNWEIDIPNLKQLQLGVSTTTFSINETAINRTMLLKRLNDELKMYWDRFSFTKEQLPRTRRIMELVQVTQNPFVKNWINNQSIETANRIIGHYKKLGVNNNILPLLFQLESSLMYEQAMQDKDIIAKGFFGHSWIKVAKTKIEDLKSTELVDEKRVIHEIENLINRGWAPIVTDERLNNTDGSHRGIAARVWNLLKAFSESGVMDTNGRISNGMQQVVKEFIGSKNITPGLTLRETLRVTQDLLTKDDFKTQRDFIVHYLAMKPKLKSIPTILLREQEACCVVKVPFDKEGIIIGVDPFVTFTLTNKTNNLALGSRGPYHRTDKTPAPWFDIFALQFT